QWSKLEREPRALAIASPGSSEGRSYVSANLAVLFAQLGMRTLLIDADFRAPRQFEIFNVPDRVGLSSVLSGRAGHEAALPVPAFGPLAVLPAGAGYVPGARAQRTRRDPDRSAAGQGERRRAERRLQCRQRARARPREPHA